MHYTDTREARALTRLFDTEVLRRKNAGGKFWDGEVLNTEALLERFGAWSGGEQRVATLALALCGERFPEGHPGFHVLDMCGADSDVQEAMLEAIALRVR